MQKTKCVRSIGDTVNYKRYRYALHFDITTSPKGCEKGKGCESWKLEITVKGCEYSKGCEGEFGCCYKKNGAKQTLHLTQTVARVHSLLFGQVNLAFGAFIAEHRK